MDEDQGVSRDHAHAVRAVTSGQPEAPVGFVRVSREQFFATLGQMNVHPRSDMASLAGPQPRSDWETPDRVRHGVSFGHAEKGVYFVREAIAKAVQP